MAVSARLQLCCASNEALHGGFTDHLLVRRSQTRELH